MPPTPPTTALRVKCHYTGPYGSHHMLFHGLNGEVLADVVTSIRTFIEAARQLQYTGTVWDSAEWADVGIHIFTPIDDWAPITSGSGISPSANNDPSRFLQFGGRAVSTGKRVKLYLFEEYLDTVPAMKYIAGANADVDASVAALNSGTSLVAAIDGHGPVWKTYVNVGSNDFLTHRARR